MLHSVFRGCLLYSASRTQRVVSLSSAEADFYACSSGAADSLLLARLLSWLSGKETKIYLYTDSSGARGILQRKGVGRLRHLSCRILWLQNLIGVGIIKLSAVSGSTNPADIGTKRLTANRLRSLMSLLGLFNMSTNTVEGSDDPGRIFSRRQNVRTLISALGLLQLQGCSDENFDSSSSWRLVSTLVLGFLILLPFVMMKFTCRRRPVPQATAEPAPEPVPLWEGIHEEDIPTFETTADVPEPFQQWSPEALIFFMLNRCQRRHDDAQTAERRVLYLQRIALLRDLLRDLQNATTAQRLQASHLVMTMTDISEDEASPLHGANETERNAAIRHSADALESEDSDTETASQRLRRYFASEMEEISDPEEWNALHFPGSPMSERAEDT